MVYVPPSGLTFRPTIREVMPAMSVSVKIPRSLRIRVAAGAALIRFAGWVMGSEVTIDVEVQGQ